MEAILQPRRWSDFPDGRDAMFRAMRSDEGERLVLDENFFIETVLPKSILRQLSEQEMDGYRAPFRDSRRKTSDADMAARVADRRRAGRRRDYRYAVWRMAVQASFAQAADLRRPGSHSGRP